jgi:hypothetical protein
MPQTVFLVTGLLADEGEFGADRAFAEYGAAAAAHHRLRCHDQPIERCEGSRVHALSLGRTGGGRGTKAARRI